MPYEDLQRGLHNPSREAEEPRAIKCKTAGTDKRVYLAGRSASNGSMLTLHLREVLRICRPCYQWLTSEFSLGFNARHLMVSINLTPRDRGPDPENGEVWRTTLLCKLHYICSESRGDLYPLNLRRLPFHLVNGFPPKMQESSNMSNSMDFLF